MLKRIESIKDLCLFLLMTPEIRDLNLTNDVSKKDYFIYKNIITNHIEDEWRFK